MHYYTESGYKKRGCQNPSAASSQSRIFLISLVYVCINVFIYLCIYLCHASWPDEKRYRPEIWYTYCHRPYLKTYFMFFSKKGSLGPLTLKNCRVTWIFRISPRFPCCNVEPSNSISLCW